MLIVIFNNSNMGYFNYIIFIVIINNRNVDKNKALLDSQYIMHVLVYAYIHLIFNINVLSLQKSYYTMTKQ
jgi:hypothetical protein